MNIRGYIGRVLSYSVFRSGPFTYIHTSYLFSRKRVQICLGYGPLKKSERKSSESFFSLFFFVFYIVRRRERQRTHTKDFEASNTTTQKRVVDFDAKQQKLSSFLPLLCRHKKSHANEAQKNTQRITIGGWSLNSLLRQTTTTLRRKTTLRRRRRKRRHLRAEEEEEEERL